MNDKEYLDRDGLKQYDALLRRHIEIKVEEAIADYEAGDGTEIHEWVPPVIQDISGE